MENDRQIVVLTGVTRGLGQAMAAKFIDLGHTVLGCGRSRAAVSAWQQAHGSPHDFAVVDVADADAVDHWATRLLEEHGPPDLLINNAGVINANAPLWQVPPDEFATVVDVNLEGTYHVLRSFLPAMTQAKRGVVVNFSSGWGRSASPQVAPYCATKWAIEGLTRALAQELPAGMAAVPLNPGVIDTGMLRSCFGEAAGGYADPTTWAEKAVPMILSIGPDDNGSAMSV